MKQQPAVDYLSIDAGKEKHLSCLQLLLCLADKYGINLLCEYVYLRALKVLFTKLTKLATSPLLSHCPLAIPTAA